MTELERAQRALVERVDEIPGKAGWWSTSSREAFEGLGRALLDAGMGSEKAFELLSTAYDAVASEFGY